MLVTNRSSLVCMWGIFVLFALGLLSGCGGGAVDYEGDPRAAMSGAVTLDGAPLASGMLTLVPVSGGRKASAVVEDGSYSIPEHLGPNLGSYLVEIRGYEIDSAGVAGEEGEEAVGGEGGAGGEGEGGSSGSGRNIVPKQYNTETTLAVEIIEGENEHDFPLTSS